MRPQTVPSRFEKRRGYNENYLLGIRRIRGKQYPFTPEDFNRKVIARLNNIKEDGFKFLCDLINKDLENTDIPETPKPYKFYEFWKNHRDYWRSKKTWRIK